MNIKEILTQYSVPFAEYGSHHHVTKGWINVDCPFCSQGTEKYRLGINIKGSKTWMNCWSCGPHYVPETLMQLTGLSFPEIKELLETYEPLLVETRTRATIRRSTCKLPEHLGKLQPAHRKYLMKRGLNPTTIANQWGVKGIGFAQYLQWRLWIPIFFNMEIISWTTRSISDDVDKRYIAASEDDEKLPGKSVLLGEDYCKNAIVIVEGPFDVFKIGKGAAATMGTSYSQSQFLRMSRYAKRIICFDSDPPGQTRAEQLCDALSPFPGETFKIVLDSAKDPASASAKEIRQIRKLLK